MVDTEVHKTESLRLRLAKAQFDSEGHTRRGGLPFRWEDLPEGNREHRLGWADKVIDALGIEIAGVAYGGFLMPIEREQEWNQQAPFKGERLYRLSFRQVESGDQNGN